MITKAPDPSNIVWENYSIDGKNALSNRIKAYLLIIGVYIVTFMLLFLAYNYPVKYN